MKVFGRMLHIWLLPPKIEIIAPRICQRMTKRRNIPAGSSKDYFTCWSPHPYNWSIYFPRWNYSDSHRYTVHAACGMYLIHKRNLQDMSSVHRDNIFQFFEWALPSPQTFNQELDVWKQMWHDVVDDAPDTTRRPRLAACEQKLFPNIFLCL